MRLILVLFFCLCSLSNHAQFYNWEVGGGLGTSNYFGDIGGVEFNGKKGPGDIMLENTRFNIGFFARKYIDYRFHLNLQVNFLNIAGADKQSPNTGRTARNLDFENNIFQATAYMEYHPLIINDLGGKKRHIADLHLHLNLGVGVAYSDPYSLEGGSKVMLRPLETEGSENKYSPVQFIMPVGVGFFISFKGRYSGYRVHRIGFNMNYHLTFTDYLDDVSTVYPELASFNGDQSRIDASWKGWRERDPSDDTFPSGSIRGNPTSNDGYLTTMVYYSKRIASGKKKHKLPRRQEFYGRKRKIKFR